MRWRRSEKPLLRGLFLRDITAGAVKHVFLNGMADALPVAGGIRSLFIPVITGKSHQCLLLLSMSLPKTAFLVRSSTNIHRWLFSRLIAGDLICHLSSLS